MFVIGEGDPLYDTVTAPALLHSSALSPIKGSSAGPCVYMCLSVRVYDMIVSREIPRDPAC